MQLGSAVAAGAIGYIFIAMLVAGMAFGAYLNRKDKKDGKDDGGEG